MANKYQGEVSIRLDRTRVLRYTFNGLVDLQDELGWDFTKEAQEREIRLAHMRTMLRIGLRHEDPDLTDEQAGDLIMEAEGETLPEKMEYVFGKVNEAMTLLQGAEKKRNEASNGAGKKSKKSHSAHSA